MTTIGSRWRANSQALMKSSSINLFVFIKSSLLASIFVFIVGVIPDIGGFSILSNKSFINKAPKDVVDKEKDIFKILVNDLNQLESIISIKN